MPLAIAVIVPTWRSRRWHSRLVERLRQSGHDVDIRHGAGSLRAGIDRLLRFESLRFAPGLAAFAALQPGGGKAATPDLVIDLAGAGNTGGIATLSVLFDGQKSLDATARAALMGRDVTVQVLLDGQVIGIARPMVSERIWLTRALNDILIRTIDLLERSVREVAAGQITKLPAGLATVAFGSPNGIYWLGIVPKLAQRLFHKLRYKPFHWAVGYRFADAPITGLGFEQTSEGYASKAAPAWQNLPDDGSRFYADPFPVEHEGRYYLFVEEFPHATGKGIIAVAESDANGRFGPPRTVLEEPFHLSYPQVFAHEGDFWMIPEGAGGGDLLLYRAEQFPDRWVRHSVLIAGRKLSDATLLRHDGAFWLFAANGGEGSSSDAMLVFHALSLEGPFVPHVANPIVIDHTMARPAGAFILGGPVPVLPVQDGTHGYGSGIGLVEILELNLDRVRLGPVRKLATPGWRCAFKHTTNRAGRLEVTDGVVRQKR